MPQPAQHRFETTRWSIVAAAGRGSTQSSKQALAELCQSYWYPLYAFARRRGNAPEAAEDLTQGFFVHLLNGDLVQTADPERGRFRSFLLKSLSSFMAAEQRGQRAQKRGGTIPHVSIDYARGERQYQTEPTETVTAEQLFERRWAMTLLQNALVRLRTDYSERGQQEVFAALEAHVNQNADRVPYAELCQTLQMSEDAVKQAARRMKLRFREILRHEVADTVRSPEEVDDELRSLLVALSQT